MVTVFIFPHPCRKGSILQRSLGKYGSTQLYVIHLSFLQIRPAYTYLTLPYLTYLSSPAPLIKKGFEPTNHSTMTFTGYFINDVTLILKTVDRHPFTLLCTKALVLSSLNPLLPQPQRHLCTTPQIKIPHCGQGE